MRVGVDTGGTFTDAVVLRDNQVEVLKVFTAPDPAGAILEAMQRLLGGGTSDTHVVHGTTAGTNRLLEHRGARVALVTTAGFEDVIEIGRQSRPRLYDLNAQREPALVSRALRFGLAERTGAGGQVSRRPSRAEIRRLVERVKRSQAESVALCLLFSFANAANEKAVARAIRGLGLPVSVSHEILPEFREYERLSTVVINAYLAPSLGQYLTRLEGLVGERFTLPAHSGSRPQKREPKGLPYRLPRPRVFVMQSSGGIMTAARAAREPVRTLLSGPAGGVVATAWLADSLDIRRAISFDMGGTSTDVCLLDGPPRTTRAATLGGLPVAVPVLDIHSVGAGGGSKARLDRGGALRVGPESAGATPGPICYGQGGTEPTVTDAHLLLGRIDADHFLGGTFELDAAAVEPRFTEFLSAQPRGAGFKTPIDLARGIVAISNATMERALRVISIERGHDPRDFWLVSFGGAGGLHAPDLARSLRLAGVLIPQNPGAFSALGVLVSDVIRDASKSLLLPVPDVAQTFPYVRSGLRPALRLKAVRSAALRNLGSTALKSRGSEDQRYKVWQNFLHMLTNEFKRLEKAVRAELRRERFPAASARAEWSLDVRYLGQSYELSVPFGAEFPRDFHNAHERSYGYSQPGRAMEVVNLRVRLVIPTAKPQFHRLRSRPSGAILIGRHRAALPRPAKRKPVWFAGRFSETPLYERERLPAGAKVAGPAVVVEYSATTAVPPDFVCRVDDGLNLVLTQK